MSKTVCIYHANCFDGMAAAWVISRVYPEAEFIPLSYGDDYHKIIGPHLPASGNDIRIIMVDFSLKREDMIWLSGAKEILVLDHHRTAEKECEGLPFCKFDMNESGASLAWMHFFPDTIMPTLVKYVKDRDLWLFKEPNSDAVNAYIQSYPMSIQSYNDLDFELSYLMEDVVKGGESISRYKETMVETICKKAAIGKVGFDKAQELVPIVNTSMLFSEVGAKLCTMYDDFPYAAFYYDRLADGIRQWGLRSKGEFDVSEIAKRFGGGGHKNAAGFEQRLNEI